MSALVNGGHGSRIKEDRIEFSKRSQVPVSKAIPWDKVGRGLERVSDAATAVDAKSKAAAVKIKAGREKYSATREKLKDPVESLRHRAAKKAAEKIEPEVAQMVRHHGKRVATGAAAIGVAGAAGGSYLGSRAGNYPGGASGYVDDKRRQGARLVSTSRNKAADKLSVDKALKPGLHALSSHGIRGTDTFMGHYRPSEPGKLLRNGLNGGVSEHARTPAKLGQSKPGPYKQPVGHLTEKTSPKVYRDEFGDPHSKPTSAWSGGKSLVTKAERYYDPETNRQRHSGMFQAAALGAGALSLRAGYKGARAETKSIRGSVSADEALKGNVVHTKKKTLALRRRDPFYMAGGPAGAAVAGAEEYHSTHPRGQAWH